MQWIRPHAGPLMPERARRMAYRVGGLVGLVLLLLMVGALLDATFVKKPQVIYVNRGGSGASATAPAAETFAARFADAYLTYSNGGTDQYKASLAPYVASSVAIDSWWGGAGNQTVYEVLPISAEQDSQGQVKASVSASTSNGWIYLSVPVEVSGSQMAVIAEPSIEPPPTLAHYGGGQGSVNQDSALSNQQQAAMSQFFTDYAKSNATGLQYETTGNIQGLAGTVAFQRLAALDIRDGKPDQRTAVATVNWSIGTDGATLQQAYLLTLVKQDSRWLVAEIGPAGGQQ